MPTNDEIERAIIIVSENKSCFNCKFRGVDNDAHKSYLFCKIHKFGDIDHIQKTSLECDGWESEDEK